MQITDFPHLILKGAWINHQTSSNEWFIIKTKNRFAYAHIEYWPHFSEINISSNHHDLTESIECVKEVSIKWDLIDSLLNRLIFEWVNGNVSPMLEELTRDYVISRRD